MKQIKPKDILAKLHVQSFRCAYTGIPLTPGDTSADHIKPVCDGGNHSADNIALVLRKVNAAKGTMSLEEFREMCQLVVSHLGAVPIPPPLPITSGELSGCDDPVEILTKLGYFDAADDYVKLRQFKIWTENNKNKRVGYTTTSDEICEKKQQKIAELNAEIAKLQVRRSNLRRMPLAS